MTTFITVPNSNLNNYKDDLNPIAKELFPRTFSINSKLTKTCYNNNNLWCFCS